MYINMFALQAMYPSPWLQSF